MAEIIGQLHRVLAKDFTTDLPDEVEPFNTYLAKEPQFFPHASGTMPLDKWEEVEPQSLGATVVYPIKPPSLLAVANYYSTILGREKSVALGIGGFRATWRGLRKLFGAAAVSPREVFLTNAYIGVADVPKEGDAFPSTEEYTARCQRFLQLEIELLKPRTIVCLGSPACIFISAMSEELRAWRPWRGFAYLDARGLSIVNCHFGEHVANAVAVMHPSAWVRGERHFEGKSGWDAEAAMIRKAASGY